MTTPPERWDAIEHEFHHMNLPECGVEEMSVWFDRFWLLFSQTVATKVAYLAWDVLTITLLCEDGHVAVFFEKCGKTGLNTLVRAGMDIPRFRIETDMHFDRQELGEITDDVCYAMDQEATLIYARLIAQSAERVGLARLLNRHDDGVRLRFYDHQEPSILEVLIGT